MMPKNFSLKSVLRGLSICICLLAVMGMSIAAYADGEVDTSFNPPIPSIEGGIEAMALQQDGKVIIGGGFDTVNGITRKHIARLNTDGSLDTTFNASTNYVPHAIAIQSDGKIIVGGEYVDRFNADGSVDTAFSSVYIGDYIGGNVDAIAIQPNGKIIVAGVFTKVNTTSFHRIVRLNSNGSIDTNFYNGLTILGGHLYSVAIQTDGKIIIGGSFSTINGTSITNIARLTSTGQFDSTFNAKLDVGSGGSKLNSY